MTRADFDDMIAKAVKVAVDVMSQTLSADLNRYFDNQFAKLKETQDELQAENSNLQSEVDNLKKKVSQLESTINSHQVNQQMLAEKALAHANSNEQYSRRNNIKILGLKLEENENCRLAAC